MLPIQVSRAVKVILALSLIFFLVQQTGDQFFGMGLLMRLALVPAQFFEKHAYWQVLTYTWMSSTVIQLFFNFMVLAFIGSELENLWGFYRFFRYFLFCSVSSGVSYLLMSFLLGVDGGPLVGPSGAIYGLLMAYGILFGERLLLFMMLFPLKAKYFVGVLGLLELLTTVYTPRGWVLGVAQLAGMVTGFLYLMIEARWRAWRPGSRKVKKRRSNHLKLIVNNAFESGALPQSPSDEDETDEGPPRTWH